MNNQKQENLEKAFRLLESRVNPEKAFTMFPNEKEEIQEIIKIMNLLNKKKDEICAPKEILEKIFEKNELSNKKTGRLSMFETLNNLINNLITMNKKTNLIIPAVTIFVFLVIGVAIFNSSKNTPDKLVDDSNKKIANKNKAATENVIVTTTTVIGDEETDTAINAALNNVLSEDDLNAEFSDIELALSDETDINQINNLFNENEL